MLLLLSLILLHLAQSGVVAPVVRNNMAIVLPIQIPNRVALSVSSAVIDTCDDLYSCRTLLSIVWSCLGTIFACIWVPIHRNIPGPQQSKIAVHLEWLKIVVLALLVPEYILAWAARQFLRARRLAGELDEARKDSEASRNTAKDPKIEQVQTSRDTSKEPADNTSTGEDGQNVLDPILPKIGAAENGKHEGPVNMRELIFLEGSDRYSNLATVETELGRTDRPWRITHAFFVIMGGFHYYGGGQPLYPLSGQEILALIRKGQLVPPTEDELKDKSKRDALSKSFIIIQTLWFVVQCIARRIEHLPITELEIMTLAYTVITVAMYGFWWCKPLNVVCPVRVWGEDKVRAQPQRRDWDWDRVFFNHDVDLLEEKQVPTFYSGGDDDDDGMIYADIFGLSAAMVFGAVHCVAWSYSFPSHVEKLLWRISALAVVAIPVILFLVFVLAGFWGLLSETSFFMFGYSVLIVCAPLYIAARILLLVLSFTTLRSLPLAAYQTVQCTTFIPHI